MFGRSDQYLLLWGARDGTVVRALASHQCGPGSKPSINAICGLSLLLVLSHTLKGFPSPQKATFSNSNLTGNQVDEKQLCGCATSKSLFIYLFILFYLCSMACIEYDLVETKNSIIKF